MLMTAKRQKTPSRPQDSSELSSTFFQTALLQNVDIPQQRILLKSPFVSIGRAAAGENDIPIPTFDSNVSRTHASLIYDDGVWVIEDHSLNGTYVNGTRYVGSRVVLRDGDYIHIGKTFHVIFKDLEMTGVDDGVRTVLPGVSDTNDRPLSGPPSQGLWTGEDGSVYRDGLMITHLISKNEFRILKYLMAHVNVQLTIDQICRNIMGGQENMVHVREMLLNMQYKLESNPSAPKYLQIDVSGELRFCPEGLK